MKNIFLIVIAISCFTACNSDQEQNETEVIQADTSPETESVEVFDTIGVLELFDTFEISLKKTDKEDSLLIDFLKNYTSITDGLNNWLFDNENYDKLNTIAWSNDGKMDSIAIEFKKKIERNGLIIDQSEGQIFINFSPKFMTDSLLPIVNIDSKVFLTLLIRENNNGCCEDASLIISKEELIQRIYDWGDFISKHPGSAYQSDANFEYRVLLNALMQGQDNSPSFNWETGKFDTAYVYGMTKIISDFGASKAAKDFSEYLEILEKEEFKKTAAVIQFIELKNKSMANTHDN